MKRGANWAAVFVVAAAVAVTAVSGYLLASWPPDPPSTADPLSTADADPAAAASPTDDEMLLVVLGDSFTAPDEETAQATWPTLLAEQLDWEVETDAVAGTGYVSDADGQAQAFPERAPTVLDAEGADVIIVAGGVDDLGAQPMPRVIDNAQQVVSTLAAEAAEETEVVVVSPFSNGSPGPLTRELNTELQRIARRQGAAYIDATRWLVGEGLFVDPMTPSAKGHRLIADRMQNQLERLGIAEPAGATQSATPAG